MALRNNPYLPLYVQDFMTDEKLMECSAEATGVYIRLMCLMHKSENYGKILLKQKHKQNDKQIKNFACQLAKFFPYDCASIERGISELIEERVIEFENDFIVQKRMIIDNEISEKRALAGKNGGVSTQAKNNKKSKNYVEYFAKAKTQANSEIKIENEDKNCKVCIEKEIFDFFISTCSNLPKPRELTKSRKVAINARLRDYGVENIKEVIKLVNDSDFLNGKSDNKWNADFDWIMKPQNFIKILEGNYKNKNQNGQPNNNSQTNGFSKYSTNPTNSNFGKKSASSIIAQRLREQSFGNNQSGNFTVDAEVVE